MVFNSAFKEKKTETEMVLLNEQKEEQNIIEDRPKHFTKMSSVNKSLKVFGLLVIYIIFWTFIFYSVEECIDSSNYYKHLQKMKSNQENREEMEILKENQQKFDEINEQKMKSNQENENQEQRKINKENQQKMNKTNEQIDNDNGLRSMSMLLKLIENANRYKKTMKQINSSSEITNKRDKRDKRGKRDKPDKKLCTFEVIELMKWSYYTVVNLLTISESTFHFHSGVQESLFAFIHNKNFYSNKLYMID